MANLTITMNNRELADAEYPAKLIVFFPKDPSIQVCENEPEQFELPPGFAKKILTLVREEVALFTQRDTSLLHPGQTKGQMILTNKEKEVLQFLSKGYSYKMIAGELKKSVETIRVQIKSIYKKLNVCSNTQAIIKLRDEKLL